MSHLSLQSRDTHSHPPMPKAPFPVRKNACIVCSVCFTCSKHYGFDCACEESQPRRGKNLPDGCIDSRAKKLHPQEKEDYAFTVSWLMAHAHPIYKDEHKQVTELGAIAEVSLCKAHSSTLYRAKKRHERIQQQTPPSPTDSNGTWVEDRPMHHPVYQETAASHSSHGHQDPYHAPYASVVYPAPPLMEQGGLAAKVREISHRDQQRYRPPHDALPESPEFTLTASTSLKRKRLAKQLDHKPYSSTSAPLYSAGMAPFSSLQSTSVSSVSRHLHVESPSFSSQLPPLHSRTTVSSLSTSLQHQLQVSNNNNTNSSSSSYSSMYSQRQQGPANSNSAPTLSLLRSPQPIVETVSLKSITSSSASPLYYIRNLVITDSFTFRDLLAEVDMKGSPPPGKRIVVSDARNERTFPLDQAIRSVIKRPFSTHVELCIGLMNKTSIDWSHYE
ncbi:hypothetical protein BDF14DRAFT_1998794 [Spinellus fusiger]|nr:hypothetical protein BDF14DRAFT_1998794 [Spinellus fusiger]